MRVNSHLPVVVTSASTAPGQAASFRISGPPPAPAAYAAGSLRSACHADLLARSPAVRPERLPRGG
jgi:hypothetical protein